MKTFLSLSEARKSALWNPLPKLSSVSLPTGKTGTKRVIDHLGYVQIDTLTVIERAHHHTLWVRQPSYTPQILDELLAKDRWVFEYWGHAASYLPMHDYRYYLPKMREFPRKNSWEKRWLLANKKLADSILKCIRDEGAMGSKEFKAQPGTGKRSWWNWKPAKTGLELLFWQGKLMVSERRNFQRIYDLKERVLPGNLNTTMPGDDELGRFMVLRALSVYGIAQENEIRGHIHAGKRNIVSASLKDMLASGEVMEVTVENFEKQKYFALPKTLEDSSKSLPDISNSGVFLLSPFDNMIILRERMKRLFNFDYTIECYIPEKKRKYGYFTLPILWGDTFIGRLDPKVDRKQKTFYVRHLAFEQEFKKAADLVPLLE